MVYQHAMCEIHQMKWKWRWIWNSDVVFHFRCEGYCCREVWDILFVDWSTENTNIFCRFHCKRLPWTEETMSFVFMTTSSLSSLLWWWLSTCIEEWIIFKQFQYISCPRTLKFLLNASPRLFKFQLTVNFQFRHLFVIICLTYRLLLCICH